jgi:hypothetical protein
MSQYRVRLAQQMGRLHPDAYAKLLAYDRYLDPFPQDVESALASLCDALEGEQQHVKVSALKSFFWKGLARASSDQADFGHRVLLFLLCLKRQVLETRVDQGFLRSFLLKDKELDGDTKALDFERVQVMLREQDEECEDGRWWSRQLQYSSGDDLSDWGHCSSSGNGSCYDSSEDQHDDRCQTDDSAPKNDEVSRLCIVTGTLPSADEGSSSSFHDDSQHIASGRESLRLSRLSQRHQQLDPLPRYPSPTSLAVWLALKANPTSTHLSECLNPRKCMTRQCFIDQMLNCIVGVENPGSMVALSSSDPPTYELAPGVHLDGVSEGALSAVATEVLWVANTLKRIEKGQASLPCPSRQAFACAIDRLIQLCREDCLGQRPKSLSSLLLACCGVRHRVELLQEIASRGDQLAVHDLIEGAELECSSGIMATSMGVLTELMVAGDSTPGEFRRDARRICGNYVKSILVCGECAHIPSKAPSPSVPESKPDSIRWWADECCELAPSTPMLDGYDDDENPLRDFVTSKFRDHYHLMAESSRAARNSYLEDDPFKEYESISTIRRSVLQKLDVVFNAAVETKVDSDINTRQDGSEIYPLPPPLQLAKMVGDAAPRLDASQLKIIFEQLSAIKAICLLQFPYEILDESLSCHVESIWPSEDGGIQTWHVKFLPPLSEIVTPETTRSISATKEAVVSLKLHWETAVMTKIQTMKATGDTADASEPVSARRSVHARNLASVIRSRENMFAVDFAFWSFLEDVSSISNAATLNLTMDVPRVKREIECACASLADGAVELAKTCNQSS